MLKCIIVDDEIHAIETLKEYIICIPELELVGIYDNSVTAIRAINSNEKVDLIFMDVDMPKISGLQIAMQVRSKTDKLVFTTAHSRYAFEAFGIDANGYLLKPFSLAVLLKTLYKLFPLEQRENQLNKTFRLPNDFFL